MNEIWWYLFQVRVVPDSAHSADRTAWRCPLPSGSGNKQSWAQHTQLCLSADGERIPRFLKERKKNPSITPPFSLTPTIHHSSRHTIVNDNYMHSWCDSTANFLKCIGLWNEGTDSFSTPLCCIHMHKWKTIWAKQLQIVFGLLLPRGLLSGYLLNDSLLVTMRLVPMVFKSFNDALK